MEAEPGRRFLIQPAAKLEPVIVVIKSHIFHVLWLFMKRLEIVLKLS